MKIVPTTMRTPNCLRSDLFAIYFLLLWSNIKPISNGRAIKPINAIALPTFWVVTIRAILSYLSCQPLFEMDLSAFIIMRVAMANVSPVIAAIFKSFDSNAMSFLPYFLFILHYFLH